MNRKPHVLVKTKWNNNSKTGPGLNSSGRAGMMNSLTKIRHLMDTGTKDYVSSLARRLLGSEKAVHGSFVNFDSRTQTRFAPDFIGYVYVFYLRIRMSCLRKAQEARHQLQETEGME